MLFSGKENVFMCLVAFQNIFRKIFSSVWKRSWKRRRKRQNLEKPGQTQKNMARSGDWRCDLAIDGAISRSVDRNRRERCFARSRSRIAIDGAISRSVDDDLDLVQSCLREIAIFVRSRRRRSQSGAISRRRDRDLDLVARSGAIAISIRSRDPVWSRSRSGRKIRCDRDSVRSRSDAIVISRARSVSLSHFPEILWRKNRSVKWFPWLKAFFFGQRISISGK